MTTPVRILFIEDSEDDLLLQIRELRRGDYAVEYLRVETVEGLTAALAAGGWELIISDYCLPRFTGLEALQLVQDSGVEVPFILISGTVGEETAVEAMKAGAADYLMKDNLTRLAPAVRRELREADERRQRRQLEAQLMQAQKLEALGTLASSIAHDFNNILAGLSGYLDLIRSDTAHLPVVQENVGYIDKGIHRATELVRRILAFSRKRSTQRRPTHLGSVVHEAIQFLRPLLPANIRVQANLPRECPAVLADAGQIHQVVVNLCTNAMQAMMAGGGLLLVAVEPWEVTPGLAQQAHLRPGPHVRLLVRDHGVGMDGDTRQRLFEPFFTTKPAGVGTGLGLAVVQNILKTHHGGIVCASQPGEGTTFELYFPVAGDDAANAKPIATGNGERLLFVDDEEYLTHLGAALVTRLGYRVSAFTDPLAALAAFEADPDAFAGLVTDLMMPGLHGIDLACRVREVRPGLPIVLATGFTGPHDLERARVLGFGRVLEKPFSLDKFAETLRDAMRGQPGAVRD